MKKLVLACAVAAACGTAGVASAGPLSPVLFGFAADEQRAGESYAPNTCIGSASNGKAGCDADPGTPGNQSVPDGAIQRADWIVVRDNFLGPNSYSFYYQVEVSSISSLETFTVQSPFFTTIGFFSGIDLDAGFVDPDTGVAISDHTSASFINLTDIVGGATANPAELETGFKGGALAGIIDPVSFNLDASNASWSFDATLGLNNESAVLFGRGLLPTYVTAAFVNGFTWNSNHDPNPCPPQDNLCARPIPAPTNNVPEPGTILILGAGLAGLGFWTRRRRQS